MAKPNRDLLHYRPRSPDLSSLPIHSSSVSAHPRHSISGHRLSDFTFQHFTSPNTQAPTSAPPLFPRNNSISGVSGSPHQRYFPPDFGMPPQTRSQRAAQENKAFANVARRSSFEARELPRNDYDPVKEKYPESPWQTPQTRHARSHTQGHLGSRQSLATLPPFEPNSTISSPHNLKFQHGIDHDTNIPFQYTTLPPLQSMKIEPHRENNLSPTSYAGPFSHPPVDTTASTDPAPATSANHTSTTDPSSVACVPPDYNFEIKTKFPVARIKRIMQADEDVGKVAQGTPVAVSKALELFMISLITKASQAASERCTKRITASHLKSAIEKDDMLDFLDDIISKVPDQPARTEDGEDEDGRRKRGGRRKKGESED